MFGFQIRVKFSQPMVPLDEYEKVQKSFPVPVKVYPAVEGAWAWSDPFTAVFTPSKPYVFPLFFLKLKMFAYDLSKALLYLLKVFEGKHKQKTRYLEVFEQASLNLFLFFFFYLLLPSF